MKPFQCPSDNAINEPKMMPLMDKGKVRKRAAAIQCFIVGKFKELNADRPFHLNEFPVALVQSNFSNAFDRNGNDDDR